MWGAALPRDEGDSGVDRVGRLSEASSIGVVLRLRRPGARTVSAGAEFIASSG